MNSSSSKSVYFINTITIISKEEEPKEGGIIEPNAIKNNNHSIIEMKEKEGEGKSQDVKQDDLDNRALGDTKGVDEVDEESEESKEEVKEEVTSLMNVIFCVLEDTTSVIDHSLGGMVLGKPFVKNLGLVYDKDERTVTFGKGNEKITFKMPHKMERFKHIDVEDLKTDNIPPFIITGDDSDEEKTYYSDSLNLRPAYRRDESVTKSIQCLIKMKIRKDKGGVM
ncbi:hypothetical protein Tco_1164713 [Tanacetum coccineum]